MTNKRSIFVAAILFTAGLAVGTATPSGMGSLFSSDATYLAEIARLYAPFSFGMVIFILSKNVIALLTSFALSPIFCFAPVLALVANGWLIGFVLVGVAEKESLFFALAGLLPHAILEIPAFILGEAAALSFGAMVLMALTKKGARSRLLLNFKQNIYYLGVALALLLPAAIIETYITPLLLGR